ncbi:arf-GAP with dual PH domain-containing protein 1 isoform X3 [Monodon monoceros]|uniref:arf-GAP with dual PH domain-containing protein 1 isoform X3 n=1 Tax=Monodon monoceros TaxID=40151 RepID=UPI0010F5E207|nr:arf-GAP with dual PH domain-containing protein 1 isoform X3 [Monodon monoceros]
MLCAETSQKNIWSAGWRDPDWASYTLGVFICLSCSGIHRNIPQVSKVKSVRLDAWDDAQVEFMTSRGNHVARAAFESEVPPFYYRPSASDCQLLREQWIRAKYERQEFTHPERQEPYSAGYREGFLWKRGRDNGQFLSRKFVLTEREGALKYFNRSDAKEPKAIMKIEHLNATFQPAKIGHPHGLQVTYLKDNSTRNIFVYHEDGKEMVDWFNALRAARFHYLQVAFPGASDADLVPKLSRNYLQEGYMEKTGPKQTEGFRKRWFTMDDRRLMYFKDPLVRMGRGPRAPAAWMHPPGSPACLGGADQHLLGELEVAGPVGKEGPGLGAARGSEQCSARFPHPGRLRPWGGLHRQQGEWLHSAGWAPAVHPGPPLAARHHHRHARAPVPTSLRNGVGAAGVDGGLPEGGGQAHAAPGVRSGSPLQAQTLARDGPGGLRAPDSPDVADEAEGLALGQKRKPGLP